ncbi:hypothetical protein GCM10010307_35600 [Streptomyces vastus]|uniref:Uncharacterized protein n=1 Tax=Streptomyces vastus TaxID=285451 RepID=A0ABP6DDD7_9ACTN
MPGAPVVSRALPVSHAVRVSARATVDATAGTKRAWRGTFAILKGSGPEGRAGTRAGIGAGIGACQGPTRA